MFFLRKFDFPVDLVYSWCDGSDPDFAFRRAKTMAELSGTEFDPDAVTVERWTEHDELKYSIRSVCKFFQCLHDFIFDRKLFKYIPFLAGMAWMTLLKFNEAWKCSKDSLMLRKYKDTEILRTSVYPVIMKYGQWRRTGA